MDNLEDKVMRRKDPLVYYWLYYRGLSRGQLFKKDRSLYKTLRKRGLKDYLPKAKPGPKSKYGDDPLGYYNKHYKGLSRGQLERKDPNLYMILYNRGLKDKLPRAKPGRKPKYDDPLGYYNKHYKGLDRRQLSKKNQSLYKILKEKGLIDKIPKAKSKYGDDPLEYYKKHYKGLSRGQLSKKDYSFYRFLVRKKLKNQIPKKRDLKK